ncbi:MAG: hypothetical protein GW779_03875 [Candidatus Altiarchaeum hamiconexum]|uniref:Uncharacterized protein n=1 Tax=Candidatus Altarchaeum hamiconexum TaxID=1803513 RepID=A0A8J8CF16_9ARCH|nr:hypothetical protein [Candidatus Altarchaeum hamiconexum]PIN67736.1 MAG: hypothetical protein COV98_01775 [Candidatus Altarchaeum sp. CG12_big_fil_rev_8_21_14_0_65_33_22]PIV28729.1 MAG: hypothetical protein COS36_01260 [Candidatus Altarchaeum sp. CG03_land_8_20_14_0_80_32_618]PIX48390.1 MAG: hypothetical protein COZ53_04165 [Candidatus Altarchaeum sp. CG_4_8_14_3_um_filter_33_2054]PIZ30868.1 MAG: hypothetical protein COY41_03480 [Candidatus Altarchaeum sp. CG_4_10_14_0_8_um_filter_32_851]PJ
MQHNNLKKVGLSVMIVIVFVGFGIIIGFGSTQDGLINKNTSGKTVDVPVELPEGLPVEVLDELKEYMDGPYLHTGGGTIKIEGIPDLPKKPSVDLSDKKGDMNVKGIKVSSEKILQHVSIKQGTSKHDLEIVNKTIGNCVKVLDKKGKITHGLCFNEKGIVTEDISIAGLVEEKVPEVIEMPPIPDNMIEVPRDVESINVSDENNKK